MLNNKIKLGINGFGRIGRALTRIISQDSRFELVAVNDVNPHFDNLAYLLKYDSTYGKFDGSVEFDDERLVINGNIVNCSSIRDISEVNWSASEVDVVIDSSGVSENAVNARAVVEKCGVNNVIVTHSAKTVDKEVVVGVNDHLISGEDKILSSSICDANAIAHVLDWLDQKYGIKRGSVTTLHPWLSYQNLVDGPAISQSSPGVVWKDYALGRASTDSLIPKNTTAVTAVEKILPNLEGKLLSFSFRTPTDIVACSDMVLELNQDVSLEEVSKFIRSKAEGSDYVRVNDESLVSLDYEMDSASATIDMQWLKMQNGLLKIVVWYDNEWGYASRVLDLAEIASEKWD